MNVYVVSVFPFPKSSENKSLSLSLHSDFISLVNLVKALLFNCDTAKVAFDCHQYCEISNKFYVTLTFNACVRD